MIFSHKKYISENLVPHLWPLVEPGYLHVVLILKLHYIQGCNDSDLFAGVSTLRANKKTKQSDMKKKDIMNNILKIMEQLHTFRTSCRSCGGSMQVSILRSRSMIADVPMCLIIKSTKSTCFCRKSTIYRIIIRKKIASFA